MAEEYNKNELSGTQITKWTVAGASKRGWDRVFRKYDISLMIESLFFTDCSSEIEIDKNGSLTKRLKIVTVLEQAQGINENPIRPHGL